MILPQFRKKFKVHTMGKAPESNQHNQTRPPPLKILFSLAFVVFVDSPVFQFLLEMLNGRCLLMYCYIRLICYAHISEYNARKSHTFASFLFLSFAHIQSRTQAGFIWLLLNTVYLLCDVLVAIFFSIHWKCFEAVQSLFRCIRHCIHMI